MISSIFIFIAGFALGVIVYKRAAVRFFGITLYRIHTWLNNHKNEILPEVSMKKLEQIINGDIT